MHRAEALAAAFLIAAASPAVADAVTYEGTLGTLPIIVELAYADGSEAPAFGRYAYLGKGVDIPLRVMNTGDGLTLQEETACTEETCQRDANFNLVAPPLLGATWSLEVGADAGSLTGIWSDGGKPLPIALARAGARDFELLPETPLEDLAMLSLELGFAGGRLDMETSPYDTLKMQAAALDESAVTGWGGSSFHYVADPRTTISFPRIVALADGSDPTAANGSLEARHWAMNADALNCAAKVYAGMGFNDGVAWAAGSLGGWEDETVEVTYLTPTVMSWTESGSLFCGGAHPYNHHEFHNLDVRTGERLDLSRIFTGWIAREYGGDIVDLALARENPLDYRWMPAEALIDFVVTHRTPGDPDFEAECGTEDLIREYLAISFKHGDRVLFGLDGLPHVIGACGDDVLELPLTELPPEFLAPEAAAYFPALAS